MERHMSKLAEVKKRIFAVEILQFLKRYYPYEELSKSMGLPPSVLSRYINGHVLPSSGKSEKIIDLFERTHLIKMIKEGVSEREGAYNLTPIHYDVFLQKLIAKIVFCEFSDVEVNKILTASADGIPLAVQVANEFAVKIVVAKESKETGVEKFLEERAIFSPVAHKPLYIPFNSIKPNENVLIVDDIVRTGATIEALTKLVKKGRATPVGIFTIFSINEGIEKLRERLELKCKALSLVAL